MNYWELPAATRLTAPTNDHRMEFESLFVEHSDRERPNAHTNTSFNQFMWPTRVESFHPIERSFYLRIPSGKYWFCAFTAHRWTQPITLQSYGIEKKNNCRVNFSHFDNNKIVIINEYRKVISIVFIYHISECGMHKSLLPSDNNVDDIVSNLWVYPMFSVFLFKSENMKTSAPTTTTPASNELKRSSAATTSWPKYTTMRETRLRVRFIHWFVNWENRKWIVPTAESSLAQLSSIVHVV